jgi:elongator complex protein 3
MGDIEDLITLNHNEINKDILEEMMNEVLDANIQDRDQMEKKINSFQNKHTGYGIKPAKRQLLHIYRYICERDNLPYDKRYEYLLQAHPVRSASGVMVVAVVLSPNPLGQTFTCNWDCKYCPSQPGQPRSYLKEEPGVLRANQYDFDPILQVHSRLNTYLINGHPTDKLEVIVLGGTWASYPEEYQYDFITKLYYSANIFYDKGERRPMQSLKNEIQLNETSKSRIIGLTLETRPDCINKKELIKFREMGVTRIQMGIQHINDRILERIDRRCKTHKAIEAIKMLKDNCFKVDIHIMPDLPKPLLPGVDPKDPDIQKDDIDWDYDVYREDKRMFDAIIDTEYFQADQWKVYPFQVTPYSKLEEEYKNGLHKSYVEEMVQEGDTQFFKAGETNRLVDLILYVKSRVPKWIRINRIVRDIPSQYIQGGCKSVNLNQHLIDLARQKGIFCKDIRTREVRDKKCDYSTAKLCVEKYRGSEGDEYFISFEDEKETTLYGFLRLRLCEDTGLCGKDVCFEELRNCALIRELHVYGKVIAVSNISSDVSSQHIGFGTRLLEIAEKMAKDNGYDKIAVISGVGVREYYRKRGYRDGEYFLLKNI